MLTKKRTNKILTILCALAIMFTSVSFVYAANIESDDEITIKIYTPDEFYAHYKEVTGKEYPNKVPMTRGSIYNTYVTTSKSAGAGYTVEVGCLVEVGCGQSCSWNSIVPGTTYSLASGGGNYTWSEGNSYAEMASNKSYIRFYARGVIEVATSQSAGASLSAAGFSFSTSVGSTYYYRKTITIDNKTYQ